MSLSKALSSLMEGGTQAEMPVEHFFSDGVAVRQVTLPAGTVLLGAMHKTKHLTMLTKGTMHVRLGQESFRITAPHTFEALAGSRKIIFCYTDCVMSNILATHSRDIEEIEREFTTLHEDRYAMALATVGMSVGDIAAITAVDNYKSRKLHKIKDSSIAGKGLFSILDIKQGEVVGSLSQEQLKTELGRYVNHSDTPNLEFIFGGNGKAIALKDIAQDEEFTVDYADNIRRLACQQ